MKMLEKCVLAVAFSLGTASMMSAQAAGLGNLSDEWWQWAISIKVDPPVPTLPAPVGLNVNPVLDGTGDNCMIGQRGNVWFLAGTTGGTAVRNCTLPEGKILFFPVINASFFNSPGTCGQPPDVNYTVTQMRQALADFAEKATNLKITLDRRPLKPMRLRSGVFEFTQPTDNLNILFSAGGACPAGVYSPTVADGWYAMSWPLPAGDHELKFSGQVPASNFSLDVTYNLKVVPTVDK